MLFTSPVAEKWLQTLNMTLIFVKPLDNRFDLHTLAQLGAQVLELGLLSYLPRVRSHCRGRNGAIRTMVGHVRPEPLIDLLLLVRRRVSNLL
jgi:hypothetical protein